MGLAKFIPFFKNGGERHHLGTTDRLRPADRVGLEAGADRQDPGQRRGNQGLLRYCYANDSSRQFPLSGGILPHGQRTALGSELGHHLGQLD